MGILLVLNFHVACYECGIKRRAGDLESSSKLKIIPVSWPSLVEIGYLWLFLYGDSSPGKRSSVEEQFF